MKFKKTIHFEMVLVCSLLLLFLTISGCGSSGSPSDPDADTNELKFSVKLINEATGGETDAISDGNPGILQITVAYNHSGDPAPGKLVTATPTKGSFSVAADGTDSTDGNGVAEIKLVAVSADGESVTGAGEISVQSGDYEIETPFAFQIGVPDSTRLGVFIDGLFQGGLISSSLTSGETLSYGGTALIVADLVDGEGNPFDQPATVEFTSQCGATLTESVLTENGQAICVYTSNGCSSTQDVVTATVLKGGTDLTAMVLIPLAQEATGSIESVSVEPSNIAVAGTATSSKPETSLVTFRVKDDKGNVMAREMVFFSLTTTIGGITVSPLSRETDENGEVTALVKSGTVAASVRVNAFAETNSISTLSGNISIEETPLSESIGSISLSSGSVIIPADGEGQVTLRAKVLDKSGIPMPAVDVDFSTTLGTLSTATSWTRSDGIAEVQLWSTSSGTALVTANAHGFLTNFQINFTPGTLMNISLQPAVTNDGTIETGESIDFYAILRDSRGNPVPNEQINFTFTDNGNNSGSSLSADSGITNDSGIALVNYIAGAVPGVDWLEATLNSNNSVSNTTSIEVLQKIVIDSGGSTDEVAAIALIAAQTALNPDDTTTITAVVYDASGHGLSGQEIEFVLDDPTLGSTTARGMTAADGTFVADFEAGGSTGTVNVTAASGAVTSAPLEITIKDQFVDSITVSVNPTLITVTKTASVAALVADILGNPVPNATVNFTLQDNAFGTITSSATTNAVGVATVTFIAANFPGTAIIIAGSGSVSDSEELEIQPAEAASIEFASVSANPITVRGTGGQEFAVLTFNVKDVNGNPAEDVDVLVTMVSGMLGSEYLESNDATPYKQVVGTSGGVAEVTLHSGFEAGTVSITASITTSDGATISATTPIISIGGGVVTDEWFVVSVGEPGWNMGGLGCVGVETNITAWLADRFGNYNVLDGHTVSFQSEVGLAVNPIGVTDGGTGAATTTIRTQGVPKDVVPEIWEMDLKDNLALISEFGGLTAVGDPLPSGNPRDGVCNVLVFTMGEESFVDGSNGNAVNGVYDDGEVFFDTIDDPWRDYDDDGQWDDGTETTPLTTIGQLDPSSEISVNPEEDEYQDRSANDQWDGENAVWDGNKNLFRQVDFLITGSPYIRIDKDSFAVENDDSDTVKILICDVNYNPLSAGSTYTVSVDAGEITSGVTSYEYPSSSFYGSETSINWDGIGGIDNADYILAHRSLIVNEITISDADPTTDEAKNGSLSITVTWKSNGGCGDVVETITIPGTVN